MRCEFLVPLDETPALDASSGKAVCRRCSAIELERFTRDRYVTIKTRRGVEIKVSPEDIEWVEKRIWHIDSNGYASSKRQRLHALIAKTPRGLVTDHINRDRLDNRRENLWVGSFVDNAVNSSLRSSNKSGVVGVHWSASSQKWTAQFSGGGKVYHAGLFDSVEAAAAARKAALAFYHADTAAFLARQEARRVASARANFKKGSDVRYGRAVPRRRTA